MNPEAITLLPHVSEQTFNLAEKNNVYVFKVPISSSKQVIKAAVEKQFKVTVKTVNVAVSKGKSKKSYQKGAQPLSGRRADTKKAYVTVKSGDKIPIYEELA